MHIVDSLYLRTPHSIHDCQMILHTITIHMGTKRQVKQGKNEKC